MNTNQKDEWGNFHGRMVLESSLYDNPKLEYELFHGIMNGLSKMWDSNGNLLYEYTNVNDEREGEGIIYEY